MHFYELKAKYNKNTYLHHRCFWLRFIHFQIIGYGNNANRFVFNITLDSFVKVMVMMIIKILRTYSQKQPPRGVLRKRCSENMQQIYRRTPMPKFDFNKVALQPMPKLLCKFIEITIRHGCSLVNSLNFFRTPFLKNTSWRPLLYSIL